MCKSDWLFLIIQPPSEGSGFALHLGCTVACISMENERFSEGDFHQRSLLDWEPKATGCGVLL